MTLILLHGFSGAAASWRAVRAALPAEVAAETVALDLPGHGWAATDCPADFAATVDKMAARIGILLGPRVVAGYSLGGRLALGLLVERPGLVDGAVLIGTQPGLDGAAAPLRAAADDGLAAELERDGLEAFARRWQNLPLFASQRRLPAQALEEQAGIRLGQQPAGLAWALRTLSPGRMPDYRPRLAEVDVPVTVVAGGDDDKFRDLASAMVAQMPTARLAIVPGSGHNPTLEAPAALAQILADAVGAVSKGMP